MNPKEISIYCDESCHLRHNNSNIMLLGAITCPSGKRHDIFSDIRKIKKSYDLNTKFEIKWTKVSESKIEFYEELIKYFINKEDLRFRALIVPDKNIVNQELQDWDTFYYKMYYYLLRNLINPRCSYNIFIDIKDTKGAEKRKKLFDILNKISSEINYSKNLIVKNLQAIRSEEVELLQLTDLIMGAVCYANRNLDTNKGKVKIIKTLKDLTGYPLTESTFPNESKFNLFKIKLQGVSNA